MRVVGLYSVCLQIMEQLDDVRSFNDESEKLRTLFEMEKLIFTRWGELTMNRNVIPS